MNANAFHKALFTGIVLATLTSSATAETPELIRVLLPITASATSGMYGSRFTALTAAYNSAEESFLFGPYDDDCRISGCSSTIAPSQTVTKFLQPYPGSLAPGYFVSYEARFRGQVHFSGHVVDLSKQSQTSGAEIPSVHEDQFRRQVILSFVPVRPLFRLTLRVYEKEGRAQTRVRLRIFSIFKPPGSVDVALVDEEIQTLTAPFNGGLDVPGYAEINIIDRYPQVRGVGAVRVEAESLDDARLWAMASVTHNENQNVTIFSPYR